MSTPPTTLPESGSAARREAYRWLPRLRDARIRSKLALILVVPVTAVVALAAARLVDSGQQAAEAGLVRELSELETDVTALAHETHRERMSAARLLSAPGVQDPSIYNAQVRRTDERIAAYNAAREEMGDAPAAIETRLDRIDEHLTTLNGTRQDVISNDQISVSEAILRYGVIINDLVAYGESIGQSAGEGDLADSLRAMASFANAKAATAEEQAVAYGALVAGGSLDEEQYSSFIATLTSQQEALLTFSLTATGTQRQLVNTTVTGDAVVLADQASIEVTRSVGGKPRITADDAARSIGAVNDLMRWAEIQMEAQLLDDAEAVRADVLRQVLMESVIVLITLAIAIALAVILARSLVRSLSQLREGALSVAGRDLPEAVAKLRDVRSLGEGGVEAVTQQVRDPIRLVNRDEVGQVAQAFNVVHREAIRIAAEQAALRTSVSAMFLNLARRSQALVDRMIGELDTIERNEEDPKRLSQLFQLDHLATRMRRNDENLLVLAGADSAAPRREDALLFDTVRAAQSEVELYNRIEFGTVDNDIYVAAHAVNDVVRLLAELLDNATRFSPPTTVVVAEARRIRDYVLIQIEDRGLGIGDEQMESLNQRLAEPPSVDVDVAAFRLMGLAVVGRLAARYGIRVELRHNTEGGTVAHVSLPGNILVLPQHRGRDVPALPPRASRTAEPAVESGDPVLALTSDASGGQDLTWMEVDKPALPTRTPAATLSDQWSPVAPATSTPTVAPEPTAEPSPAARPSFETESSPTPRPTPQPQWSTPAESIPNQVTAAHPTLRPAADSPYAGYGAELLSSAYAASTSPTLTAGRGEELPIFREMEASWFRTHDPDNMEPWALPTAGHPPPPAPVGGENRASGDYPVASTQGTPASTQGTPASAPVTATGAASMGSGSVGSATPMGTPAARPAMPSASSLGRAESPYTASARADAASETASPASGQGDFGGAGRAADRFGGQPPQGYGAPEVPADGSARHGVPKPRKSNENGWQTRADEGWRRAMEAAVPAPAGITRSGLPKRVPQAQLVPGGVEPAIGRDRTRRTPEEVRGLLSAYHRGVQRGRLAGEAGVDHPRQTKETTA